MGHEQEKHTHTHIVVESGHGDNVFLPDIVRVMKEGELFIPFYLQLLAINRPGQMKTFLDQH